MRYASAGAHALHVTGANDRSVAHAVAMFKRARQNISNDFHVAMRVRRETLASPDAIFVDDAQAVEMRVRRIEVLIEREGVISIKPPKIKVTARF